MNPAQDEAYRLLHKRMETMMQTTTPPEQSQLHVPLYKSKSTTVTENTFATDQSIATETHNDEDQIVLVVEGSLLATVDGKATYVSAGQSITIKAGHRHELKQTGCERTRFFSVYAKVK